MDEATLRQVRVQIQIKPRRGVRAFFYRIAFAAGVLKGRSSARRFQRGWDVEIDPRPVLPG